MVIGEVTLFQVGRDAKGEICGLIHCSRWRLVANLWLARVGRQNEQALWGSSKISTDAPLGMTTQGWVYQTEVVVTGRVGKLSDMYSAA